MTLTRAFMLSGITALAEQGGDIVFDQVSDYLGNKYPDATLAGVSVILGALKDIPAGEATRNPLLDCIDELLGDE